MTQLAAGAAPAATPPAGVVRMPAGLVVAGVDGVALDEAPIAPDWILEGTPRARAILIARGADRQATLSVWECTAGRFLWHFGCDEAVYIVEGAVVVTGPDGITRRLEAGDSAWFPAHTWFEWWVPDYVRKVAFCHDEVPAPLRLPLRALAKASRIVARLRGRGPAHPPRAPLP